ncbi:MAG: MATE family efflux transporter, partial [Muribaculaceae bacterium]|nr:MATE family efflux transporter [Muribaculaceae bacterium]
FMSLTRQVIFLLPLLFTLPSLWQLNGVWLSFPISDMFATLVAALLVWIEVRKINTWVRPQPSTN